MPPLAFLDHPALLFAFLEHHHSQKAGAFRLHIQEFSDSEQRMCVTPCKASEIWAPTALWLLGKPQTYCVGDSWWEVKTLLFIKPGQNGDGAKQNPWWGKVLELHVQVLRGKCPQSACCICPSKWEWVEDWGKGTEAGRDQTEDFRQCHGQEGTDTEGED